MVISKALLSVGGGIVISGRGKSQRGAPLASHTLRVLEVVGGSMEDLERTGKVQKIELFVDGEKDVDGLVRDGRGLVRTHLGGFSGGLGRVRD